MRKLILLRFQVICLSICKSVCPHCKIWLPLDGFKEIFEYFSKIIAKIQMLLNSDKNNGYLTKIPLYISDHISLSSFRNEKYFKQSCRDNQKTYYTFIFNNFVFENHAVYELIWKNTVERDRPQMTIWLMHHASLKQKVTNAHSEYVKLIAFPNNSGCSKASYCYLTHYYLLFYLPPAFTV
jgi:hypothetical protein